MEKTNRNPPSELERLTQLKNSLGSRDQKYWTEHQWRKKMWEEEAARRIKADRDDREFDVLIHLAETAMNLVFPLLEQLIEFYFPGEPGSHKSNDKPKNSKNEQ